MTCIRSVVTQIDFSVYFFFSIIPILIYITGTHSILKQKQPTVNIYIYIYIYIYIIIYIIIIYIILL